MLTEAEEDTGFNFGKYKILTLYVVTEHTMNDAILNARASEHTSQFWETERLTLALRTKDLLSVKISKALGMCLLLPPPRLTLTLRIWCTSMPPLSSSLSGSCSHERPHEYPFHLILTYLQHLLSLPACLVQVTDVRVCLA